MIPKTNMCIHCIIRILGTAPCIYSIFLYFREFPEIPWGFPITINIYQGISQFGQDQARGSEGVKTNFNTAHILSTLIGTKFTISYKLNKVDAKVTQSALQNNT